MASTLAAEDDLRIVGQPTTPVQLIRSIESLSPHVLILSSSFLPAIDAIRVACARQTTAMLLLRDYGAMEWPGFPDGVQAVIDRSTDGRTIVQYVRQLARGGGALRVGSTGSRTADVEAVAHRVRQRLTSEEMAIIACVVRGCKNREIANRVGATEPAIKNALRRIFDKTGVYGRLELALFVVHHRIVIAAPEAGFGRAKQATLPGRIGDWKLRRPPSVN